jgi:DNA (cytosine-5)-methyltransferase 1
MRFLSVCSGIEAASVAWNPLGWEAAAFSEIEPFPCQVLKHYYPDVPNLGDMTKFKEWNLGSIDLFCGGTPCQSFSVAGLRKGLDDPRGNLMLTYLAIADKFCPRWLVWENVPGVLSSNGGRDFGAFLGGLGQLGYGFAYRVLDAQYFGVAQRRRRVFVVGYLGDWRPAAAVLFERDSLRGNPAPSRKKGQDTSKCLTTGSAQRYDAESETMIPVAQPIGTDLYNGAFTGDVAAALTKRSDGTGTGPTVMQPTIVHGTQDPCVSEIAFAQGRNNGGENVLVQPMAVRRLTPVECERLQGFPDHYTDIKPKGKPTPDGPRYKALGNSWAVPVVRWIGERIMLVEGIK